MKALNERVQEVFEDAKLWLKDDFDLTLTLGEQVALRMYAKEVVQKKEKLEEGFDGFNVITETASMFLSEYYNLPPLDKGSILDLEKIGGWYKFQEYLKIVQDKAHLI